MPDLSMFQVAAENKLFADDSRGAIDLAGHLLSDTAHDLRSPLAAARELVQLVADGIEGPVSERQKQHLDSVVVRCDDMQRLIDDMLQFEGARTGTPKMLRRWIAPSALPAEVQPNVQSQLNRRYAKLRWVGFEKDLPPIFADLDKVKRLLVNLIANAIQVVEEGDSIEVRSEIARSGDRLRLSVVDNGLGMSDQQITNLAKRGYSEQGGQGLGLAICRQIAAMHFARIGVDSKPNQGSRFSIEVPTGGPTSVVDAFARWRESILPSGQQSKDAGASTGGDHKIRPRRVEAAPTAIRVLPPETPAPRFPRSVTMVSAVADRGFAGQSNMPLDAFLQGDCLMNELVYRVEQDQWLMLWDTSVQEAQQRIDRLDQARGNIRNQEPLASLQWFGPVNLPVGAVSDRQTLREAFIRGSLGLKAVPAPGGVITEVTPPLSDVAQKRLEAEVKWITGKFKQRQNLLYRQLDAIQPRR